MKQSLRARNVFVQLAQAVVLSEGVGGSIFPADPGMSPPRRTQALAALRDPFGRGHSKKGCTINLLASRNKLILSRLSYCASVNSLQIFFLRFGYQYFIAKPRRGDHPLPLSPPLI